MLYISQPRFCSYHYWRHTLQCDEIDKFDAVNLTLPCGRQRDFKRANDGYEG